MVYFCPACIWGLKRTPISSQFLQGARPRSDLLSAILGDGTKPSWLTAFVDSKPDLKFQLWPSQHHQKQKDLQCFTHNSIPLSYHLLFCFLQNSKTQLLQVLLRCHEITDHFLKTFSLTSFSLSRIMQFVHVGLLHFQLLKSTQTFPDWPIKILLNIKLSLQQALTFTLTRKQRAESIFETGWKKPRYHWKQSRISH